MIDFKPSSCILKTHDQHLLSQHKFVLKFTFYKTCLKDSLSLAVDSRNNPDIANSVILHFGTLFLPIMKFSSQYLANSIFVANQ